MKYFREAHIKDISKQNMKYSIVSSMVIREFVDYNWIDLCWNKYSNLPFWYVFMNYECLFILFNDDLVVLIIKRNFTTQLFHSERTVKLKVKNRSNKFRKVHIVRQALVSQNLIICVLVKRAKIYDHSTHPPFCLFGILPQPYLRLIQSGVVI